jgi:hypothetical protein
MAEKKIKLTVDVDSNIEPTIANLKLLKKQLKETAAGSAEFNKISQQIRDMDDAIKDANKTSDDFLGYLENASGPLGMLGKGIRQAEQTFSSFNAVLKASVIGLLVAAIGGLVAAFAKSEAAVKKLQPLMIGLEKILGGIFKAFEPLLDAFIELATNALPYITKGIGTFYSGLYSLFTLIKNVGVSAGKILKGVFTLDFEALKEGAAGIKDAFSDVSKTFDETYKRFEAGTKEQTKTEKEELEKRQKAAEEAAKKKKELEDKAKEAAQKAFDEKVKRMEAEDKLDEASLKKLKEEALLTEKTNEAELLSVAKTEEEKQKIKTNSEQQTLDIEKRFAELSYQQRLKDIQDKQALYKTDSTEYKNLQTEKINEEANYLSQLSGFKDKQKQITEETNKVLLEKAKKKGEEERGILLTNLQTELEDLDRKNKLNEFDFEQDLQRLAEQRDILAEQESIELQNTELTEFQKTEIRKKYADARKGITDQEIATEKAAAQAKQEINMAYLQLFEQFGNVLGQVAGKNKALAIAGIIISQAASIGQIIANTGIANAKAVAANPVGLGQPWVTINTISAGLSIASTIASAAKSIQQINQASSQAGVTGGGGGSVSGGAPQIAPPRVGGVTAPEIQTGQGINPTQQIGETIAGAQRPLRAYVISGEVSSQQALDRRTSRAATFTGG